MFPRLQIIYLILIFGCCSGFTQALPTGLLAKWNKKNASGKTLEDTATVNLLNSIAYSYMQHVSDSANFYAETAIRLSKKIKYPQGQITAYATLSKLNYKKGNYRAALKHNLKLMELSSRFKNNDGLANAHNMLGLVYLTQNKQAEALYELRKAIVYNRMTGNRPRLAANYFNLSLVFHDIKRLDSAIAYAVKCRNASIPIKEYSLIAMSDNRLGDYYHKLGQTSKAIRLFYSVINNSHYQDEWENSFAYTGLAECHFKIKDYNKAVSFAKEGLKRAQQIGTKWDIQKAYKILHESSFALGDYKTAYQSLLKHEHYSDSLDNETRKDEINEIHLRHKEVENKALMRENENVKQSENISQMVTIIVLVISVSLILVVLLITKNLERKKRLNKVLRQRASDITRHNEQMEVQNNILQDQNETKDYLLSIIGHDMRGPLGSIISMWDMFKAGDLDKEEMQFVVTSFFEKVTTTFAMLENILHWAKNQQSGIKPAITQVSLTAIADQVLRVYKNIGIEKNISIVHHSAAESRIEADEDLVRIMIQNIVANAIKFTKEGGNIDIAYQTTADTITITVKDNGIGMSPTTKAMLFQRSGKRISTYGTRNENGTGLGMLLVKTFAEKNNAVVEVDSALGKGSSIMLTFRRVIK